jgi:hypothetical protein
MTTPDYQTRCYEYAARTYANEFTWMAFFDTDEYLVIDPPFDLRAVLNLWDGIAAIGVPWAMFGSSGHVTRPDALLIEAFTHRAEPAFGPNRHIKSIIRPSHMQRCENAHLFSMDGEYRSLAGKPLAIGHDTLLTEDPDYALGKLHHYFTRSRDHWADKLRRGYHDTTRNNDDFEIYDRNEIFDDSAARHAPKIHQILATLDPPASHPAPSRAKHGDPAQSQLSNTSQGRAGEVSHSFLQERTKELFFPAPNASGIPAITQPVMTNEARQSSRETSQDPRLEIQPRQQLFQKKNLINPLYPQGFVIGWEYALLGNCLSSYANLFAFSQRTGIAIGYQQLLNIASVIETHGGKIQNYSPKENFDYEKFKIVNDFVNLILMDDVDILYNKMRSYEISEIKNLKDIRGEIILLKYTQNFKDMFVYESDLQEFCERGNGVIMRGAYWYQYHDMRELSEPGRALRRLLAIKHVDSVYERRRLMDTKSDTISIGIHMRRGKDYEKWIDGNYYFQVSDYLRIMGAIHNELVNKSHRFYVCSDVQMDKNVFSDLPVCYVAASLEDDFSALSKCDIVVGPPSTFGTWSAFLGNGKRIILTKERVSCPEKWAPILEHSVNVIYPTGAYIPGDFCSAPV